MAHIQATNSRALLTAEFTWPEDWDKAGAVASIFLLYNDKASLAPRLQYLYCKRHIVQLILTHVWPNVTWSEGGVQSSDGQQSDHLQKLYDDLTVEINDLQRMLAASRGGAIGAMTATAPIMPGTQVPVSSTGNLDANARRYRGDPILRR